MAEIYQYFKTVLNDGVRLAAFDMTYQADPAGVVLKTRVIKSPDGLVMV
jgi:hypothetical protein